jgi:DNA-binding transcriptional LysR family regulator
VLAASPGYLRRHGFPDSLESLKEHRCLTLRPGGKAEVWEFKHAGKEVSIKVNSALAINSSESLRACVLNGGGIAILPTYSIGPDIKAGKAVPLLPDLQPAGVFGTHLYAVYLKNRFLTPKVRVFIDFLIEKIGEKPYWDDY